MSGRPRAAHDPGGAPAAQGARGARGAWSATLLALLAYFFVRLRADLSNSSLFSLVTSTFPYARDLTTVSSALTSLAILTAAAYRPALLGRRGLNAITAVLALTGFLSMVADFSLRTAWLAVAGSAVTGVGMSWLGMAALVACCTLPASRVVVGVPLAMAASKLVSSLVTLGVGQAGAGGAGEAIGGAAALGPAQTAGVVLMAVAILGSAGCSLPASQKALGLVAAGPARADASILHPSSYLPLTSTLFVSLFLLKTANGFEMRFQTPGADVVSSVVSLVLLAALATLLLPATRRDDYRVYDNMFSAALLFVMLAFLLVPLGGHAWLAADFLAVSTPCINLLLDLLLISVARRNPLAAVGVVAFGSALGSLGTTLGANVGALVGAEGAGEQAYLLSAAMAGALLAYVLFAMRGFSFARTISGIEPVRGVVLPQSMATAGAEELLRAACGRLTADRRLSPREADVLELLARGRNNAYIQEALVVTRNTVKSHIRHIYTKLDVHSQQELIDLVDRASREAVR